MGSVVVEHVGKKRRKVGSRNTRHHTGKINEQTYLSTPPRREHKSALRMEGSMS